VNPLADLDGVNEEEDLPVESDDLLEQGWVPADIQALKCRAYVVPAHVKNPCY
jgi:hypothetical protein